MSDLLAPAAVAAEPRPTRRAVTLEELASDVRHCDREIARFAENFGADPFYAFGWADDAIKSSARRKVALAMTAWLTGDEPASLSAVRQKLQEMVWREAQYPTSASSQPMSLELARQEVAAAARAFERLAWLKEEEFDLPLPPPAPRPAPAPAAPRSTRRGR